METVSLDLFVPALAGYVFLRLCNVTRFGVLRESGYHLIFRSAFVGVALYIAGWLLARQEGLPALLPSPLGDGSQPEGDVDNFGVSEAALWSLAVGIAAPLMVNCIYWPRFGARRAAEKIGDFVDLLIDEASGKQLTLEISLRDGKTYVGYVTESRISRYGSEGGALVLVPLFSGYRDRDTHELTFTNVYAPLLLSDEDKYWKDLEVAIPRSDVRWARLFDITLYRMTEGERQPRVIPSPAPR